MDTKMLIAMLTGTIARGIMWGAAAMAGKLGIDTVGEDTARGVAGFVAAAIVAVLAMLWSWFKNKKLLNIEPPK